MTPQLLVSGPGMNGMVRCETAESTRLEVVLVVVVVVLGTTRLSSAAGDAVLLTVLTARRKAAIDKSRAVAALQYCAGCQESSV